MKKHLPALALFFVICILLGAVCMVNPSAAGQKKVTVKAYVENNMTAKQIADYYGIRISYLAPFDAVSVSLATYMQTDTVASLSLYKWQETYEKTIDADPLVSKTFEGVRDNQMHTMEFDTLPAGEYLLMVADISGSLAVWQNEMTVSRGYCYENSNESRADWRMTVRFTEEVEQPFGEIQSALAYIDGNYTAPAESVPAEDSLLNTHKVMPDTWVFTDGLGRTSLTYEDVGGVREDKTLAMFYWTWHIDNLADSDPVNVQELSEKYPDAMNDYDHVLWNSYPENCFYWNEPIYGYYRSNDTWVLRRQAELLANAGVDAIFTDNTNGEFTWRNAYIPLFETWSDAVNDGVATPKVSFMLPFSDSSSTKAQLKSLYMDVYRQNKYQNLWYYLDGKPMLMANKGAISASASLLEKEISNFFTFRAGQPLYVIKKTTIANWGWLSIYPQAIYYKSAADRALKNAEQITVGVSMNYNYVTKQLDAMNGSATTGRSYTTDYEDRYLKEGTQASLWGYNFEQQWNYALEVDPKVVFVTGWNEFTAGRHEDWCGTENAFPDQYNDEYSRDIEPTKGNLKDHYYYQLVNFVRKYKGCNPIPTPTEKATIDLMAGTEQWASVGPYYAAYIGNTDDRDAQGCGSLYYTETSGRNDIIGAKVARDDEFVYFYVECNDTITPYTDTLWMNLYIDCDQSAQGWETFDFVVNKSPAGEKTLVLEKFTAENDYAATEKVADVEYTVNDKTMTVKIPKSALGLSGDTYTVNFAWTDNVHDEGNDTVFSGDIMDFYISGDVAPGARFKYSYISTAENAGGQDAQTTDTQITTAEPSQTTTDDTAPANSGCGSSLSASLSLFCILSLSALALPVLRRRKSF